MLVDFTYTFSDEEIEKCQKFAAASSKNHYAKRNQFNKEKISTDIIVGKLGEIATCEYLKNQGDCSEPDFEIYSASKKSWAADLFFCDKKVCVKSQEANSAKRYGESWVFQNSNKDKGGQDKEVFGKKSGADTIICFVRVDAATGTASIRSINTLEEITPLFDEPKLEYLRGIKKVIYFDKLQSCKKKLTF